MASPPCIFLEERASPRLPNASLSSRGARAPGLPPRRSLRQEKGRIPGRKAQERERLESPSLRSRACSGFPAPSLSAERSPAAYARPHRRHPSTPENATVRRTQSFDCTGSAQAIPQPRRAFAPCGHSLFRAHAESSAPGTGPCGPHSRPSAAPFPPAGKKEGSREEKRRKRERLEYPSLLARSCSGFTAPSLSAERSPAASCGTQPLRRASPRPEDQTFRLVPRPEGLSSGPCRAVPSSACAVCPRVKKPGFGRLPHSQGPEDKGSAPPRRSLRLRFRTDLDRPALFRARSSRSAPGLRGLTGRAKAPRLHGPGATVGSCGPAPRLRGPASGPFSAVPSGVKTAALPALFPPEAAWSFPAFSGHALPPFPPA